MYINPFERMKNLKLNTDDTKSSGQKENENKISMPEISNENTLGLETFKKSNESKIIKNDESKIKIDGLSLTSYEIVRDLMKIFKEKSNESQFFLAAINDQSHDTMTEIISSFFSMPIVNIDLLRIDLYASSFLFLLKKIIKGLPKVSLEDKKILWDRVKLFARTLKNGGEVEQINDSNSIVIVNELEFDDPLEYIKKEFEEILKAYEIKENIVVIFSNIDLVGYGKFKKLFGLVQAIFKGILSFKFIVGFNPILIETYVKQTYGNHLTEQLVNHEIGIYNKKYIVKNDDDATVRKEEVEENTDSYFPMKEFLPTEDEDEEDDTIGFDYWAMRGGK